MTRPFLLAVALGLLLAPAFADAGCGHSIVFRAGYEYWPGGYWRGAYYAAGYYPAVQKVVAVPVYSVSYNPDSAKQLEIIDRAMQVLEKMAAANLAPREEPRPQKVVGGLDVLRARCAACHQAGNVEDKGAKLTILDGQANLAPLSLEEKKRVVARVHAGDAARVMPPRSPLPGEEKAKIAEVLGVTVVEVK